MSKRIIEVPLSAKIESYTAEDLMVLKEDLGAMGVQLSIPDVLSGGKLVFKYDNEAYKRNAGRKKKAVPLDSELAKMTQEEINEWILNASIDEIQNALNIGRATAYRRVSEARTQIVYEVVSLANIEDIQEEGGVA